LQLLQCANQVMITKRETVATISKSLLTLVMDRHSAERSGSEDSHKTVLLLGVSRARLGACS